MGEGHYGGRMAATSLPDRFVTDASLAHVARRLRMLGFDIDVHRGARLEELLELARADGRIVLTRSPRRPKRFADVHAVTLPGELAAAVRTIIAAFTPASAPLRRCPTCNTPLQSRSAFEARGEVPGRVTRTGGPLTFCPSCGRWFWIGSHVAGLRNWTRQELNRQLDAPVRTMPPDPVGDPPSSG